MKWPIYSIVLAFESVWTKALKGCYQDLVESTSRCVYALLETK